MPTYHLNEGEIQIPAEWKDTTIHAFVLPGEAGGGAASFVITRDADAASIELQAYADQQLVSAAQQLPAYNLVARETKTIGGQTAIQSDFTWLTPERVSVRQRQACLRYGNSVLVLTLTGREDSFQTHAQSWDPIVDSLRLRAVDLL